MTLRAFRKRYTLVQRPAPTFSTIGIIRDEIMAYPAVQFATVREAVEVHTS
jgi:hypothetical protein